MESVQYFQGLRGRFLSGRSAVITGSSKGIGREMALTFARLGAKVAVTCVNNYSLAQEVVGEIEKEGGRAFAFQGDLSKSPEAKRLIDETAAEFGGIDVLINNAGITDPRPFDVITEDDWDRMLTINLKSMYNCCKYAIPFLRKSNCARILNLSSVCGKSGAIGAGAHYCAAKAGTIGFSKALANQLAPDGITVNSIAPAMIDTEMIRWRTPELMRLHVESIPLKRIGTCAEVAGPAAFLCSQYASFITGYCMDINGGMYMD